MSSRSARITIIRHEPPDQVRESIALPLHLRRELCGFFRGHTDLAHGINQRHHVVPIVIGVYRLRLANRATLSTTF